MESQPTINPTLPAGYQPFAYEDPFEDHVGPFGYKVEDGRVSFAFQSDERHRNTGGTVHGGMLMTFADYALCLTAVWDQPGERCITVSFNCEFVAAGRRGDTVESRAEVIRRTGSFTFVRGQIFSGGRVLLTCSVIVKRIPGGRVPAAGG